MKISMVKLKTCSLAVRLVFVFAIIASFWFGAGQAVWAASVGEQTVFNVDSVYDAAGREKITATLRFVGQRGYFYVDENWFRGLSSIQQSAVENAVKSLSREFDQTIYPQITAVYGSEWNPGIDNDPRVTILISKMLDEAGGYFSYLNEYPKIEQPTSNEREMISLNASYIDSSRSFSFLAHEFQHLITFYQKQRLHNIEEDYWLNEARSEYASTLLGYDKIFAGSNLERRVKTFLSRPSDSLTEWRNETGDYGVVNLFTQYLVDHYGTRILTLMTQSDKIGIASIDFALQTMGYVDTFNDIFIRWAVANYSNDCNIGAQKTYCYSNPNLSYVNFHVDPTSNYALGQGSLEVATWVKDWSPRWYKIDSMDNQSRLLQVNFEGFGSSSGFRVPYIVKKNNNSQEVNSMTISPDQKGGLVLSGFGAEIKSIILMPINMYKKNGFTSNDINTPFSLRLSTVVNQPAIFVSGSLVKSANDSKVYLIDNGTRQWIMSAGVFIARGFKWEDIRVVADNDLALYPEGKAINWPDGSLVKSGQATVYIISSGKKRPFTSANIFVSLGYEWKNIKIISQPELDQYELDSPVNSLVHADGTLVRFSDSPNIYLIELGKKRLIPSVEIFMGKKYNFDLVVIANPILRSQYPDGAMIS